MMMMMLSSVTSDTSLFSLSRRRPTPQNWNLSMCFPPSSQIVLQHNMTYSRGIETSSLSDKVTCQAARSIPSLSTTARCPGMLGLPVIPGMHHTWYARCFARLRERQKLRRNLRLAPRYKLVLLYNKSRFVLWSCLHVYQIQAQKKENTRQQCHEVVLQTNSEENHMISIF